MKVNCRPALPRARATALFAMFRSQKRFPALRTLASLLLFALGMAPALAAPDVTSQLEYLGNPFAQRYTGANSIARSVIRMRLFNNRIYMGHGNSGGYGPTDLWAFDLGQDAFIKDGVIFEELIDQLRVFGTRMYMNGRDSMSQGAIYRLDPNKGVQMFNIAEDGHYFDCYEFGGKIFSNVGVNTHPWPRLAISSDDGATFTIPVQNSITNLLGVVENSNTSGFNSTLNGWEFMEFGGNLYLGFNRSATPDVVNNPPFILKYTGNDSAPLARVHWLFSDFFGDGTVALPSNFTEFNGLGIFTALGNLCSTPNIETPHSANKIAGQPAGLPAADSTFGTGVAAIRSAGGKLYTAYNFMVGSAFWTAICETSDGTTWTELGRFSIGSRVRGFERAPNGDFYLGAWGILTTQGEAAIPGNVYRLRAGSLAATPPVYVDVSADTVSVFKSSGNNLSLRIRRSGPTNAPVTVNYSVSGTAVVGADYTAPSGSAIIPAGSWSVDVPIAVLNNPTTIGARTVIVTLTPDAAYAIATPASITFTITDQTAGGTTLPQDGLALWFRADLGVTSAPDGSVGSWADQSGRSHNATQLTPSKQPKLTASGLNGRPAITFDAANHQWLDVGPIYAQAYAVAVVYQLAASHEDGQILNLMSYTQTDRSGLNSTKYFYNNLFSGGGGPLVVQPGHDQFFKLKSNGANTTYTPVDLSKIITPDCNAVKIGTRDGTNNWFNGSISEIIIYNRPLSAAEIAIVDAYLSQRYAQANQNPVAAPDAGTRSPGAFIDIPVSTLLANDADADGGPLGIASLGSATPPGASVTFNGSAVRYTPPANNNANGSFTYQLGDILGATASGAVTINVSNNPPTPGTDFSNAFVGQPLLLPLTGANGLLANDSDADGDAISLTSFDPRSAAGGTIRLSSSTGQLIYVPPSGFSGSDSFHYTIQDARGLSAIGTVQISVLISNHPPVAGDDTFNRSPNKPLTIQYSQLLANDSDPDGPSDLPLTIIAVMGRTGAGAKIVLSPSYLTYTAPPGYNGSDSFTYTVRDQRGAMASATVSIFVGIAPSIASILFKGGSDVSLSVAQSDNGALGLRAVAPPGTFLQIDSADDPASDWSALGQIRTGQNGVAYLEAKPSGTSRFFKASVISQ